MPETDAVQPQSEKMKKALRWVCEITKENPEMSRQEIIRKAEVRFDLSPAECEFLDRNFC